jgi:hypothetical protein
MTKAPRGRGAPIQQFQNSRETMVLTSMTSVEQDNAREVVANYVKAWHGDLSEREQIDIGVELIRLLGLQVR